MRYCLSLFIFALISCGGSNTAEDEVEIESTRTSTPEAAAPIQQKSTAVDNSANGALISTDMSKPDVVERPPLSDTEFLAIRELLLDRKFDELNQLLSLHLNNYYQNREYENQLIEAYSAFGLPESGHQVIFEDWINKTPKQYQPYLAAAQYHFSLGWSARGHAYYKDVPESAKVSFANELHRAAELVLDAIALKPDLMPAYLLLIDIEKSTVGYQNISPTADAAFKLFPESLALKFAELEKHEPRWGGSFEKMMKFTENAIASQPNDTRLKLLRGMINIEHSHINYSDSDYERSLINANIAISYGENAYFYFMRAKSNMALDYFPASLKDINTAIALRPSRYKYYKQRAKIHVKMENYIAAMRDFKLAAQLTTSDRTGIDRSMQWAAKVISHRAIKVFSIDLNKAVALYENALLFDEHNHYSVYWRAIALTKLGLDSKAIEGFNRSIKIDPTHFESYRILDSLLVKTNSWDEIIANWDSFLQLEPEHAEGFLERSGSHYHNGNMGQAKADLSRACDLKSAKACAIMASLE